MHSSNEDVLAAERAAGIGPGGNELVAGQHFWFQSPLVSAMNEAAANNSSIPRWRSVRRLPPRLPKENRRVIKEMRPRKLADGTIEMKEFTIDLRNASEILLRQGDFVSPDLRGYVVGYMEYQPGVG